MINRRRFLINAAALVPGASVLAKQINLDDGEIKIGDRVVVVGNGAWCCQKLKGLRGRLDKISPYPVTGTEHAYYVKLDKPLVEKGWIYGPCSTEFIIQRKLELRKDM